MNTWHFVEANLTSNLSFLGIRNKHNVLKGKQVYNFNYRLAPLWCVLGLLLSIRLQCKCHGQGGHKAGRQPSRCYGQETPHRQCSHATQAFASREACLSFESYIRTFFHVRLGRYCHARTFTLLRHEIWRIQKGSGIFRILLFWSPQNPNQKWSQYPESGYL